MTTQPQPRPPCAVCGKPSDAHIPNKYVCALCYLAGIDVDVRLYQTSLKVVRGGLPR